MTDKQKALEAVIAQVERQFGKGSVMRLGEATRLQVEAIPTGSVALDMALGVGGIPRGRITEIYGSESSGKTTLGLHIIAEAQKRGGNALFVDAEHALDPDYARAIGVDVDRLYISQPSTGDEALEIMDTLIRSGAFDVAVLDSVAALMPRQELEGDIGDPLPP
jgi:recombination protein RecA